MRWWVCGRTHRIPKNRIMSRVAAPSDADYVDATPKSSSGKRQHSATRRQDIDGLRGIACAAVVVNHIDHRYLEGGFVGVDMFFVISGYVVTLSFISHPSKLSLLQSALAFYARRVRRLLPLSVTVVAATAVATSLVVPADELEPLRVFYDTLLSALIGWTNNFFAMREFAGVGQGYWGAGRSDATWNPGTHL